MTENNTPECKYHQAEDTALSTPDSPLDVLSSIIKPQTGKEYILPALICLITLVHFFAFSQWDSFWINIIRLSLSILTISYIINIAHKAYNKRLDIIKSFNNNQPQFFTTIVVFGGMLAIFIPMIMNITKLIDNSALLTTALLTITGGIIAIFGYYITHQKSELEKEQMNMQKQKDARDHIRQLHDSYNDRFDKAVAELNSNDVKSAYAAVPKLAKLADAWLDYKDLSDDKKELKKLKKKAKKEAQTIINILCKYIRTMPGEYTEEDLKNIGALNSADQDKLKNESEVRRLIFSEISDRSSTVIIKKDEISTIPGTWSNFDFDFSRAPIFYPLNAITIEKGNFSSAKFYSKANFDKTTFIQTADFSEATFTQPVSFWEANFAQTADFRTATFTQPVRFWEANFTRAVSFWGADFAQRADFSAATFSSNVDFEDATFKRFEPTFTADYWGKTQFSVHTAQEDYDFSVHSGSKPIQLGKAELDGIERQIPVGTVLFDPDSGRRSEPAKPIEESDNQGETPSK